MLKTDARELLEKNNSRIREGLKEIENGDENEVTEKWIGELRTESRHYMLLLEAIRK